MNENINDTIINDVNEVMPENTAVSSPKVVEIDGKWVILGIYLAGVATSPVVRKAVRGVANLGIGAVKRVVGLFRKDEIVVDGTADDIPIEEVDISDCKAK